MTTHLQLLDDLTFLKEECAIAQDIIDRARAAHPHNTLFNLQLNAKQTELDEKLEIIKRAERVLHSDL